MLGFPLNFFSLPAFSLITINQTSDEENCKFSFPLPYFASTKHNVPRYAKLYHEVNYGDWSTLWSASTYEGLVRNQNGDDKFSHIFFYGSGCLKKFPRWTRMQITPTILSMPSSIPSVFVLRNCSLLKSLTHKHPDLYLFHSYVENHFLRAQHRVTISFIPPSRFSPNITYTFSGYLINIHLLVLGPNLSYLWEELWTYSKHYKGGIFVQLSFIPVRNLNRMEETKLK